MSTSATPTIPPLDTSLAPALEARIDGKTKPLGALGRLESLALQLGLIQQSLSPQIVEPHILVCAGDHGAARAGVSAYPQEVTWQMVENFLRGGAAINVFARQSGARLVVVDAGVAHEFGPRENLVDKKIGAVGTANYLEGPAMSDAQCRLALEHGAGLARSIAATGCNTLGFGEMGIGNTASASLLTHCLTGLPLAEVVGRGTGLDAAGLARKHALLEQALAAWPERPQISHLPLAEGKAGKGSSRIGVAEACEDALSILARFGGFEIVMLAGAMLEAARSRMTLVIDGFIVTSAFLAAQRLAPDLLDYAVFSHRSNEAGHRRQLDWLGATPLLDLDLRLGEGTGAALALPLLRASCAFLNEMASFESAGVSRA